MTDFTHLHVHTQYSFLDGMCEPRALARRCVELGMSACAVTDHRHMGAALAFYQAMRGAGVKPILGMEAVTADFGHLVILARDGRGYGNLRELATRQQSRLLSISDLETLCPGLQFLTACVANTIAAACARGQVDVARASLTALVSAVGARRVCIELQPNAGPHLRANAGLQELAIDQDLRCVVTNDVHYLDPGDAEAQNVLMAIRQKRRAGDANIHRHPRPEYYLKSGAEMAEACARHGIDARHLASTQELVGECGLEIELGRPDLPPFSDDDDQSLDDEAWSGLKSRALGGKGYDDRLAMELDVISDMGFSGYFLIVQDFVAWARDNGCAVGPGRGSGAGSLVAYVLGITDLDPLVHKLFFERFLNPERKSMPDFDIDFMQERRGDVIDYVVGRWGREHVGQIATYMSLHPKSAIKDVARALGMPYSEINDLTKSIPTTLKAHTPEEEAMSEWDLAMTKAPDLVAKAVKEPGYRRLLSISKQLTGCVRHTGKHAGGVVIGRLPLTAYTPLTDDGRTQYNMNDVEAAGLVKFDFLGVKTLDVIEHASRDVGVDIRDLGTDDAGVYDMISGGDTWGLFQVESPGMTTMCRELMPDGFDDIVAAVALYRPGPMASGMLASFIKRKHGEEEVKYEHPDLEPVLADTYGTIVYQEQVMQAAQALAGYTLGGADILRRAMGKKKPEEMARQRQVFVDGCLANDIGEELASKLFDVIEKFSGYGFNRCVTGDTVVVRPGANANSGPEITVRELWDAQCSKMPWGKKIRGGRLNLLQMDDDGVIRPGALRAVHANGVAEVFHVETRDGQRICVTGNHRLLTSRGYVEARDLIVDEDELVVMGEWDDVREGRQTSRAVGKEYEDGPGFPEGEYNPAWIDGRTRAFAEAKARVADRASGKCEECECGHKQGDRFEFAHTRSLEEVGGDYFAYHNEDNLRWLCNSCHKSFDYSKGERKRRWTKGKPTTTSVVSAVVYAGKEEVFDLEMSTVGHNFVANGVVSHNSHAAAYALITYQTAWLKLHHPLSFTAALLTMEVGDQEKLAHYVRAARGSGLKILGPDANFSDVGFQVEGQAVRWGLAAIKGLGPSQIPGIVAAAPYTDIYDMVERSGLMSAAMTKLIDAGACDRFHDNRQSMRAALVSAVVRGKKERSADVSGQTSLMSFVTEDVVYPDVETGVDELEREYKVLGSFVSGHPAAGLDVSRPGDMSDGEEVTGVVVDVFERRAKKSGKLWAKIVIEDEDASMTVLAFPDEYKRHRDFLVIGELRTFTGRVKGEEFVAREKDNGFDR